jgi:hypothetical protein
MGFHPRRSRVAGLGLLAMLWLSTAVLAQPYPTSRPGDGHGPTKVEFAVAVLDVSSIDSASQAFTADMGIALRWRDPRLALPGSELRTLDRTAVWNPDVYPLNERDLTASLPDTVDVLPDGTVLYRQRFNGEFRNRIHVRDFPFDAHDFRLQFVSGRYGASEVAFTNGGLRDRTGVVDDPLVVDWKIESWRTDSEPFASKLSGVQRAAFALEFHAARLPGYFLLQLLLPLALVVVMSWGVFWLDPQRIDAQIGMAATAVLTLIAFRFAFPGLLPRVSYLTRVDYFISGSTVLVFAALLQVLVTGALVSRGRDAAARTLDHRSRIAFPLMFALLTVWSFLV